jgi:NAD(P)-dependent dehydrogenase (short-subunit alcohol dehydrogenase family)
MMGTEASMFGFAGARILITGAGGGVGTALTAVLAGLGGTIIACDLPGTDLSASHISQTHHFDLCDRAGTLAAAAAILADGAPHIVISNAGWTRQDTLAQTTPAGLADEMERNFTGPALLTHALLPAMRGMSGNRAFVMISSVNAVAHHGNPAYSAAKAALLAWMRAIAVEEGRHGIRANAVIPASIRTAAWDYRLRADPGVLDRLGAIYPLGRIVTTQEVAHAVAFLASALASGISGTSLTVDAGLMAGNLPFLDAIR